LTDDGLTILGAGPRSLGGLDGAGTVQYNGTQTLSIGIKARSGEYVGSILNVNGGSLEKVGAGTLTLSGNSDLHGGELRVTAGALGVDDLEARLKNIGLLRLAGTGNTGTINITGEDTGIHAATVLGDGNGRINKIRIAYGTTQLATPHLSVFATLERHRQPDRLRRQQRLHGPAEPHRHNHLRQRGRGAARRQWPDHRHFIDHAAKRRVPHDRARRHRTQQQDQRRRAHIHRRRHDGVRQQRLDAGHGDAGTLNLRTYNTSLQYTIGDTSVHNIVIYQALVHSPGASLEVDVSPNNTISFATAPPLSNGILGEWATINGADWATIGGTGELVPYTAYTTGTPLVWSPKSNIAVTDNNVTLSSDTTVNTAKLSGNTLIHAHRQQFLQHRRPARDRQWRRRRLGGVIVLAGNGKLSAPVSATNVQAAIDELSVMTVAVPIVDNPVGPVGLIKSGDGTLVLAGHNTYTGATAVQRGELKIKFQDGDIPTGNDFTVDRDATLNLDGNHVTLGKLAGNGAVDLGNGGGTLKLEQAADTEFAILRGTEISKERRRNPHPHRRQHLHRRGDRLRRHAFARRRLHARRDQRHPQRRRDP
jgi:autotransporter-associated beta strand protein